MQKSIVLEVSGNFNEFSLEMKIVKSLVLMHWKEKEIQWIKLLSLNVKAEHVSHELKFFLKKNFIKKWIFLRNFSEIKTLWKRKSISLIRSLFSKVSQPDWIIFYFLLNVSFNKCSRVELHWELSIKISFRKKNASTGNWTRVPTMATLDSTTKPLMLDTNTPDIAPLLLFKVWDWKFDRQDFRGSRNCSKRPCWLNFSVKVFLTSARFCKTSQSQNKNSLLLKTFTVLPQKRRQNTIWPRNTFLSNISRD